MEQSQNCGVIRREIQAVPRIFTRSLAIAFRDLVQACIRTARRWLDAPANPSSLRLNSPPVEGGPIEYAPLKRLILTDEVGRTLFGEFAEHRQTDRSEEETGWTLFGLRHADEAVALATLPAGAERNASQVHVKINSSAQAFGSRILRQGNKKLTLLGVVHTHPGSLRHPSDGDYRGDIVWVESLRTKEGIFGIGTAEGKSRRALVAHHPHNHQHCLGELSFCWYSLKVGDRNYHPLPVEWTIGPDLALPLRPVWDEIEEHAERLDRLARQLQKVQFDVVAGKDKQALKMILPLAEPDQSLQVLIEGKQIRYLLLVNGEPFLCEMGSVPVDQGVYLLLAELAQRSEIAERG